MIHFASSDILSLYSFTVALIKLSTMSPPKFLLCHEKCDPQKPPGPDDAPSSSPATATRSVAHTWYPLSIHILLNTRQGKYDKSLQYKTFLRHERRSLSPFLFSPVTVHFLLSLSDG